MFASARRVLLGASWLLLVLVAAGSWYLTVRGLAFRGGLGEAAGGLGLVAAVIVGVTLWRWTRGDRDAEALRRGNCPRCGAAIRSSHEHARPGGIGLALWACPSCGFDHTEPLTCERCAA